MNTNTIITWILLLVSLVGFTWWGVAQNNVNKAEKIIAIDEQIRELNEEIDWHKQGYEISVKASEECRESFMQDAEKEHIEANKKRELIKKLEEEKEGLMMNR